MRVLCSYCMCGSSCHSSVKVPSKVLQLAVATAVLRNIRPTQPVGGSGCVHACHQMSCCFKKAVVATTSWSSSMPLYIVNQLVWYCDLEAKVMSIMYFLKLYTSWFTCNILGLFLSYVCDRWRDCVLLWHCLMRKLNCVSPIQPEMTKNETNKDFSIVYII